MHVVATAGHVDHGKSTLVRALTGMDPDRWAEEKRRGLTIDLGFAWTTLPSGADVAFVDVPGHERFVTNMLAGVGPAPSVVLVVAADEGWKPQTEEHVRALRALGVRHALLVVTRSDLADPQPVLDDARDRLAVLGHVDAVAVSATTGEGLGDLVAALDRLVASVPTPDPDAPVRLWIDRSFTIDGAGTVVTGTLTAGRLRVGDRLLVVPVGEEVVVRGLESRQQPVGELTGTARVAVNLRGVDRRQVPRGAALVSREAWQLTGEVDVVLTGEMPPGELVTHVGSAAIPTRVRMLGDRAARLRLDRGLPLHLGDRLLLREPAGRAVVGADVADLTPPTLRGRGAAAERAATLAVPASADDLVRRNGAVTSDTLRTAGLVDVPVRARRVGRWWVDPDALDRWGAALRAHVRERHDPLSAGLPVAEVARSIGVPDDEIVRALATADPELDLAEGRIRIPAAPTEQPAELRDLLAALQRDPLAAPDAEQARGIGAQALAHGARTGVLLHLGGGVYVAPHAVPTVLEQLAGLSQPFTVSAARQALGKSRRVVVPLLEHLDAARLTRRAPDGTRVVVRSRG
jgi:selenocysteine-specific elongation factor